MSVSHFTFHGSSSERFHIHPWSSTWRILFDSISPFFLYLSFLPFSVFFLYPELFLELDNPTVMASLRYSAAEESEDTLNSFTSPTHSLISKTNSFHSFGNGSRKLWV